MPAKAYCAGDIENKLSRGVYSENYTPARIILALYGNSNMTTIEIKEAIGKKNVVKNLDRMVGEGLMKFKKGYASKSLRMGSLRGANCKHYWLSSRGESFYEAVKEKIGQYDSVAQLNVVKTIQTHS